MLKKYVFFTKFYMLPVGYFLFPKSLPVTQYNKKYDIASTPINVSHTIASNAPPDDNVGDVTPVGLFTLVEGNNFPQEIEKISNIIKRLPNYAAPKKDNLKIQTINNIPTGIIKI
jgi:hypothetical protein